MYYALKLLSIPQISNFYCITRNTVWQITEKTHILIFVSNGSCEIEYGGSKFTVCENEYIFIPKNHSYIRRPVNNEKCTLTYIHFDLEDAPEEYTGGELQKKLASTKDRLNSELLQGEKNSTNHNYIYLESKSSVQNQNKLNELLNELNERYFNKSITSALGCSISLCGILTLLSHYTVKKCLSSSALQTAPSVSKSLRLAISYIMRQYSSPISLSELAEYCSISKQQLIRCFKSELSTTPNKYITEYKISRAKELLFNHPQLSVGEISDELGFDNQHYFSKVFFKTAGETPSHYRSRTLKFTPKE